VRGAPRPDRLRLRDPRALRAAEVGGCGGRAGHPAHRPHGPEGGRAAGQGPGRRPPGRDPHAGRAQRAAARDDADEPMAEDLTEYYHDLGVRVRYLHSDIETLERVRILRDLRKGEFDVLVGINLLREGLDLPEVSLVAILDADKEGFLRSSGSLIQTIGR